MCFQIVLREAEIKHGHNHESATDTCLRLSPYSSICHPAFTQPITEIYESITPCAATLLSEQNPFVQVKPILLSYTSLSPYLEMRLSSKPVSSDNYTWLFGPHSSSHCLAQLSNPETVLSPTSLITSLNSRVFE